MKLPSISDILRFTKFGMVGLSGTLINLAVLWLCNEYLYQSITGRALRFNLALTTAISLATLSNFIWNRKWTWGDRKAHSRKGIILQFAQYTVACWMAILIQFLGTNILSTIMHYMLANMLAIGSAALLNYVINNLWTFAVK